MAEFIAFLPSSEIDNSPPNGDTATMFRRALELILSFSVKPNGCRDSETVQERTIGKLRLFRNYGQSDPALTDLCIRFVQGESWSLLYLWLKCKHGWPGGSIEPAAMESLEKSLEVHFYALELESDLTHCEGN